jgi:hypothetical protein
MIRRVLLVSLVVMGAVGLAPGKDAPPPPGIIAASVGEQVVLVDPDGRWVQGFEAGTVGWLYPAPAGVLFAPDLIRGRTTVFDLLGRAVAGRFDAVTMPHFGPEPDRYVVVLGEVMLLSYPDRAVVSRFDAGIDHPWQVIVISNTAVLVLDRRPDGEGGATLVAADPISRRVVYRRRLPGDVHRMALSVEFGLIALADSGSARIRLVEPLTLAPVVEFATAGPAVDVAFLNEGKTLVAAVETPDGRGNAQIWQLKKKKTELKTRREAVVELTAAPVRMAGWPGGLKVAVGLATGKIEILDLEAKKERVAERIDLPGVPRDVVWCDLTRPGPSVPDWSDAKPPELVIGPPPS